MPVENIDDGSVRLVFRFINLARNEMRLKRRRFRLVTHRFLYFLDAYNK